jgi:hypothetical protein
VLLVSGFLFVLASRRSEAAGQKVSREDMRKNILNRERYDGNILGSLAKHE